MLIKKKTLVLVVMGLLFAAMGAAVIISSVYSPANIIIQILGILGGGILVVMGIAVAGLSLLFRSVPKMPWYRFAPALVIAMVSDALDFLLVGHIPGLSQGIDMATSLAIVWLTRAPEAAFSLADMAGPLGIVPFHTFVVLATRALS